MTSAQLGTAPDEGLCKVFVVDAVACEDDVDEGFYVGRADGRGDEGREIG